MSNYLNRLPVSFYLVAAIILDTLQQLLWKSVASTLPNVTTLEEAVVAVSTRPAIIIVVMLAIMQLLNWLKVLERADLSYAMPITAISYVTVSFFSVLLFEEKFYWQQAVGILSIVLGIWCVAQTVKSTTIKPNSLQ